MFDDKFIPNSRRMLLTASTDVMIMLLLRPSSYTFTN